MNGSKCRCCYSSLGSIHLSSYYHSVKHEEVETYQSIFEKCSGFYVGPDEPQLLCPVCLELLLKAYEFYKLTQGTQCVLINQKEEIYTLDIEVKTEAETSPEFDFQQETVNNDELSNWNGWSDENQDDNTAPEVEQPPAKGQRISLSAKPIQIEEDEFDGPQEVKYECPYCPTKVQTDKKQLGRPCKRKYSRFHITKHIKGSHPAAPKINCEWCSKWYYLNELYDYHMNKCSKNPDKDRKEGATIICPYCAKMVPKSEFNKHIRYHEEGPIWYVCDLCNTRIQSKSGLTHHMMTKHLDTVPISRFHCEYCSKAFVTADKLKIHLLRDHQVGPKLQCNLCKYSTFVPKDLKRHINRHNSKFS